MGTPYLAIHFTLIPRDPFTEILIAELSEYPFESFEETDNGLIAYIPENVANLVVIECLPLRNNPDVAMDYSIQTLAPQNWNEEWERDFPAVVIDERCRIRAPFHEAKGYPLELIIHPKMSFGTGHHPTTYLMISYLLDLECAGINVLDMGCGTGILGIAALQMGAKQVTAVDTELWCVQNTLENARLNQCTSLEAVQLNTVPKGKIPFDLILANINRNILVRQMEDYLDVLKEKGSILLSGFYSSDLKLISSQMTTLGFRINSMREKDEWMAVLFDSIR